MRLRTLGAVCATSAATVPLTALPTFADAQAPPPPVQPAPAPQPAPPTAAPAASVTPPGDIRTGAMARLTDRHLYFARRYHRLLGDPLSRPERQQLRVQLQQLTPPRLRAKTHDLRGDIRQLRGHLERRLHGGAPDVPIPPQLKAIAACESGGDPRAISAGGQYRGKYQFDFSTWRSVGGKGDPAAASETEQDRRAAKLYRTGGPGHWPICGR
jgi:soluble lytic murein transglycosylase-like protein